MNDDDLVKWCKPCDFKNGKYTCYDEEEMVACFWALNVTGNMNMFNFDTSFEAARSKIENKLAEHGLMGVQEYADFSDGIYGSNPSLEDLAIHSDWISVNEDEIREVVFEYIVGRLKEEWEGREEFEDMQEILEKLDHADDLTQSEKVLLFDKIIHLKHVTGSLFDIDIERLREEFEGGKRKI